MNAELKQSLSNAWGIELQPRNEVFGPAKGRPLGATPLDLKAWSKEFIQRRIAILC